MSNEELAERIRGGETDLILTLWQQVEKFAMMKAKQFNCRFGYQYEIEDLMQSGFLATYRAALAYAPESEFKFLTLLGYYLRAEFIEANGIKHKKNERFDPLEKYTSLNTPLTDEWDADTLGDLQPDPGDPIGDAERRIWLEQLRRALDAALDQLPRDQKQTLTARYYQGLTLAETAAATDTDLSEVRKHERRGLDLLRKDKHKNGLEQFIDSQTNFYNYVSVNTFNTTHSSAVEKAVIYRENIRQQREKQ